MIKWFKWFKWIKWIKCLSLLKHRRQWQHAWNTRQRPWPQAWSWRLPGMLFFLLFSIQSLHSGQSLFAGQPLYPAPVRNLPNDLAGMALYLQGDPLVIYGGISPNGDGSNDQWIIENIEQYPNNLVQLFNRAGMLIYQARGYNNTDQVFEGFANQGIGGRHKALPEGTYFYRISIDDASTPLRGYIILSR